MSKEGFANFIAWLRQTIVYILFWLVTAIAAFEAGLVFEMKGVDGVNRRLTKLETNVGEISGKMESHTAQLRGLSKGRPIVEK